MKAVIYARYSSDRQTEDSIEAQLRACNDYACAKGFSVVGVYKDEAISGKGTKTASRTQYQKMLRDCDKGLFDTILVHKYDRVARSLAEHVNLEAKLQAKDIALIATAQDFGITNEAKIMRSLMWVLSEYYIDNLSDEVKKGHKENALKALHNGGVAPFGYDVVNKLYVVNDLEAGYVRRIFQCAAQREGFVDILREMEEAGIKGKRGKTLKYTQIYEMLRNEKYTGVYVYSQKMAKNRADRRTKPDAIRIENAFPAIIDRPLFEEVQQIMSERKQTGKKGNYLCSGLVYCNCGAKMHGLSPTRKGHTYSYYSCSKKCGAPVVKVEDIDTAATNYLHELLSPENQMIIAVSLRRYQAGLQNAGDDFNQAIRKEIGEKQKQYDALMDNLASGALPADVVTKIGQKMQTLQNEMEALKDTPPPHDFTVPQIVAWLESLKAAADEKAVHLLVERIDVKTKTDISITSTLTSVLGETGRGDRI